jgi:AcrR family transcriptional regulator
MSEGERLDRRVIRTRRLLRDALMELILEKGYDSVTVQDITDRANLGRATFYLHYPGGKDELLISSLERLYEDLAARIAPMTREEWLAGQRMPGLIAFEHAAEQRALYRVILNGGGSGMIARRIREYMAHNSYERLRGWVGDAPTPVPLEIIAQYMAGSLLTLIGWWLEQEQPHSSQEMADYYYRLIMPSVRQMLNLAPAEAGQPGA